MKIKINNNLFNVKTLITSKDTQEGMMFKKFDKTFDGVLFFMEKGPHSFWMKNCIIPLDIIFISNDTIDTIHHRCKPCRSKNCENYKGFGDLVLELPSGACKKYGIKEGDKVYFNESKNF